MNDRAMELVELETALTQAVDNNEFILEYQPQIDLATQAIVGVEALIRWQHPERGLISPNKFIPLAEETGLIIPIGEWVLRTACAQNKAWQRAGHPPIQMGVNLCARQFRQQNIREIVGTVLQETGLEAKWLNIEITETDIMTEAGSTIETLQQLAKDGVHISLDDFGTGYSSLNYLKILPVITVKIDRGFVWNLEQEHNNNIIIKAIIVMARQLGLKVIAEGVETREQLEILRDMECDIIQGFYFSKPVAAEQIEKFLEEGME